jgi:excisionase family DNA binding protein
LLWHSWKLPAIFAPTHLETVELAVNLPEQETMQEQERWLSVEEIAVHLGVNRDTIYKWIDRKQMPAHKLGKLWKFKATEIDGWIRAGKAGIE